MRVSAPPLSRMLCSGKRISAVKPVSVNLPALSQIQSGDVSSPPATLLIMSS
jgi:hypothetical protein